MVCKASLTKSSRLSGSASNIPSIRINFLLLSFEQLRLKTFPFFTIFDCISGPEGFDRRTLLNAALMRVRCSLLLLPITTECWRGSPVCFSSKPITVNCRLRSNWLAPCVPATGYNFAIVSSPLPRLSDADALPQPSLWRAHVGQERRPHANCSLHSGFRYRCKYRHLYRRLCHFARPDALRAT